MIARLACHVVPHHGIVFIALPLRCIQAVGEEMFLKFLAIFRLKPLLPPKRTPKIVFYTLQSEIMSQSPPEHWKTVVRAAMNTADPAVLESFRSTATMSESFSLHLPLVE